MPMKQEVEKRWMEDRWMMGMATRWMDDDLSFEMEFGLNPCQNVVGGRLNAVLVSVGEID